MYWTLELASKLEDAPWPATKDELIDYARDVYKRQGNTFSFGQFLSLFHHALITPSVIQPCEHGRDDAPPF